jgi:hypothetical protein
MSAQDGCHWNRSGEKMIKTRRLQVRLTDDEFEKIKQIMADYEYSNLSEFIRDGALKPSRKNKKVMGSMIYEVNKIGVNLNQAIHKLHLQEIDHAELLKVINQTNHLLSNILCVYSKL